MIRTVRSLINFFSTHHKLEYLSLSIALTFIILSAGLGWFFYGRIGEVDRLLRSGIEYLQSEDYKQAIASFEKASLLNKIDLKFTTINLSKEPTNYLSLSQKLEISHKHFIAGLADFDKKDFAAAITELGLVDKVDKEDTEYRLAKNKIVEAKSAAATEEKLFGAFENYYKQSLASCEKEDYESCIRFANSALSLVSEDYRFDKDKINQLNKTKKMALASLEEKNRLAEEQNKAYVLKVPILMYHFIRVNPDNSQVGYNLSVTPDDFEAQMAYLAQNGFTTIDVATVAKALRNKTSLPSKSIVITFDDGYRDFYTTAFPVLQKYNLHAESYVITGFVGGDQYMTWDMIKEVQRSGLVTIGSHTVHHRYLTAFSSEVVMDELTKSKEALETNLGVTITDFCYPYGAFNNTVAQAVEKAGYLDATTTMYSSLEYDNRLYSLNRVRVSGGETLATFISRL